jgi:hypothetical protein
MAERGQNTLPHFSKGGIMKYVVLIAACALMSGCGDADEDTGEDTAAVAE